MDKLSYDNYASGEYPHVGDVVRVDDGADEGTILRFDRDDMALVEWADGSTTMEVIGELHLSTSKEAMEKEANNGWPAAPGDEVELTGVPGQVVPDSDNGEWVDCTLQGTYTLDEFIPTDMSANNYGPYWILSIDGSDQQYSVMEDDLHERLDPAGAAAWNAMFDEVEEKYSNKVIGAEEDFDWTCVTCGEKGSSYPLPEECPSCSSIDTLWDDDPDIKEYDIPNQPQAQRKGFFSVAFSDDRGNMWFYTKDNVDQNQIEQDASRNYTEALEMDPVDEALGAIVDMEQEL